MPARRALAAGQRSEIAVMAAALGPDYAEILRSMPTDRTLIVNGMDRVSGIFLQAPLLVAFRRAGYRSVIVYDSAGTGWNEDAYRLFGITDFVYFEDYLAVPGHPCAAKIMDDAREMSDLMGFRYSDIPVGKYALSTSMRRLRSGRLDLSDATICATVGSVLDDALRYTDAVVQIIDKCAVDAALILDRGYSPQAQIFELTMLQSGCAYTWNSAHRNGLLMLKRYNPGNMTEHPSTLSGNSWRLMKETSWSPDHWHELHQEIETCYQTGEWFSGVRCQVDKMFPDKAALKKQLGIDNGRKTAVIFAHIFWDSTFFWGKDLFGDFETWFKAAVQAACENTKMNWLIKIHPANMTKDRREGIEGESLEIATIQETIGELPPHVKILPADSEIATHALLSMTDYCLTVRGTVGIEAACYEIPVITAGTGRYDRRGFTIDPETQEEYFALLADLEKMPPLPADMTELARRFAYGLFLRRPAPLTSFRFAYDKDPVASLLVKLADGAPINPAEAKDIESISRWIESGAEDYLQASDETGSPLELLDSSL